MHQSATLIYIPVPVPKHVAQFYLVHSLGLIHLKKKSKLGNILLAYLEPQPADWKPTKNSHVKKSLVHLVVCRTYAHKKQYLSAESTKTISILFQDIYRDTFCFEVDKTILDFGKNMKDAINIFRTKYGISEDLFPFISSYKCYQRHKTKDTILKHNAL